jgi:uncharacterized membrane protein YdbT with pleckstrin-like domain
VLAVGVGVLAISFLDFSPFANPDIGFAKPILRNILFTFISHFVDQNLSNESFIKWGMQSFLLFLIFSVYG